MSRTIKKNKIEKTRFSSKACQISKAQNSEGSDIQVHGSGELIQLLHKNDPVDELWLKIYPLTLGKGKK